MNAWTVFLAAFAALAVTARAEYKVVCYFGSWAVYRPGAGKYDISYIDPTLCTHMIYTFVGLGQDDTVKVLDPWQDLPDEYGKDGFGRFNKLRQLNPDVKTMIAIGGWNEGSAKYSELVANPTRRAKFVNSVVKFLDKYGFDGFDVDWEYPNQRGGKPRDKENYIALLKELKEKFAERGYLLSAAVGAAETSASQSYNIAAMSKYLDFINLMSYDLHGAWEATTGINAPLYARKGASANEAKLTVDASIKYWLQQGAPAEKLVLGVPFYGRAFTLQNKDQHGVGAPTTGPGVAGPFTREKGMLGYNEICSGDWTVVFDEEQRTPYAYNGNQWVGFDNIKSLTEKAEYVKAHGLGGAMVWSIETDDFQGACGEEYALLKTLNHVLRNGPAVKPTSPNNKPKPTEPSKPTPPSSGVCTKEGYVRDPVDCGKFYNCINAGDHFEVYEYHCPEGLIFDPAISACNYTGSAQC